MRVISLSWGRQSFALAVMAALGEIPAVDVAIFADTDHERTRTYEFADRWTAWLGFHGLKIIRVKIDHPVVIEENQKSLTVNIPAFTTDGQGSRGQLRRQCADDWKIGPMRRWLQAERDKQPVELLLGISLDEFRRMRPSDVKYITHRWPLVDMRMTREDCEKYLLAKGLEVPPKSSCVFCPYHDNATWKELSEFEDWGRVVDVDRCIRKARPPFDLFLHQARRPIEEIDLRSRQEKQAEKQYSLWEDECAGICGG